MNFNLLKCSYNFWVYINSVLVNSYGYVRNSEYFRVDKEYLKIKIKYIKYGGKCVL